MHSFVSLLQVEVKTKALENDGVELEMSLRKQASPGTECKFYNF